MRIKFKLCCCAFLLVLLLMPMWAIAQKGAVSGKVTNEQGEALPGANVLVQGLDIGAATNSDGEFTITNVPVGQRTIVARFIGYKNQVKVVNVTASEVTAVNFELPETVLDMDEVVVTGAGIAQEKTRLGNTVATINRREIELAPVQSISEILQAREVGINVLPSSGLVGEGARIRIRGSASLSQSNEPVVYVDGIRVDNAGGFAGTVYAGGGGVPSRLDDINPESIERVEILKGAAAATLCGTQAAKGIIQIFTKQGQYGKPRFTFEVEQSTLNYPDVYKPNVGFARDAATAKTMSAIFYNGDSTRIQPFQLVTRTTVKDMFSTGLAQT